MKRIAEWSKFSCGVLFAATLVASDSAFGQQPSTFLGAECAILEPDSVQISWNAPCESGDWIFEPHVGCRMWDWHPAPSDTATWTGLCRNGLKSGYGISQWFEHGRTIDRFEGTFVEGRRQGVGRYTWNEVSWYVGFYKNDLPSGQGTAYIAGETFSGQWRSGCFTLGSKTVAIGVSRKSCDAPPVSGFDTIRRDTAPSMGSLDNLSINPARRRDAIFP
jgi:MORN repeat